MKGGERNIERGLKEVPQGGNVYTEGTGGLMLGECTVCLYCNGGKVLTEDKG